MDPSLDTHVAFTSLAFDVGATTAVGSAPAPVWGKNGISSQSRGHDLCIVFTQQCSCNKLSLEVQNIHHCKSTLNRYCVEKVCIQL